MSNAKLIRAPQVEKSDPSEPIISRPPAFIQNPVITQNKYDALASEGTYEDG